MRLGIYIRSVETARGAERVAVNLARGLAERGHEVDLLLEEPKGWLLDELRDERSRVKVVHLKAPGSSSSARLAIRLWMAAAVLLSPRCHLAARHELRLRQFFRFLFKQKPPIAELRAYIARETPHAILSLLNFPNMALLCAAMLSDRRTRTVVSVHNTLSAAAEQGRSSWATSVPKLMRVLFGTADAIVAVSSGVAEDVAALTGISRDRVTTIFNPVFRPGLSALAEAPLDHRWLISGNLPVVLGAGKLKPQKDFGTLIRAFAKVREKREARLVILGEGSGEAELKALVGALGIADDVDFPGQVQNPFAYYRRASVFVLSSRWEGLPTALVEAMACGCPVVSTDCPSGPVEILEGGRHGALVPVGGVEEMTAAILAMLEHPTPREQLVERARHFSLEAAVTRYEAVLAG